MRDPAHIALSLAFTVVKITDREECKVVADAATGMEYPLPGWVGTQRALIADRGTCRLMVTMPSRGDN